MPVTAADLQRDYLTMEQIQEQFNCSRATAARWRARFFDKSAVEVSGGRYYVHKDELERWRKRYGSDKPVRGRRLPV